MGILSKALEAPSSYAAKKTDLWADLCDRIEGCLIGSDLDAFIAWLDDYPLEYPASWRVPLEDMVDTRREEIRSEEIGQILRDRFDF